MRLALLLLFAVVSCTTPKGCSCQHHLDEDVGPLEPLPPPKEAIELIQEKDGTLILLFRPDNFPDCAALEVVFDEVDYGIIVPGAPLYVQNSREETHQLEVTCLDDMGLPLRKSQMVI